MGSGIPEHLAGVSEYYSARVREHGETPRGVDWNGIESQHLRFVQLCRVIDETAGFSVNDLGCGYGALLDYLDAGYSDFRYDGFDISADMVAAARARHAARKNARFAQASSPDRTADYGIASGIFNVRLQQTDDLWRVAIEDTLRRLNATSARGFAFNCLTSYSDADRMQEYLYYADPCSLFDFCKREFSREVALLHDYGLYEFTILVRKS